ncbi:hypothetical protein HYT26_00800 [Candidatus Pacearchaeota archaeon]|nr:hypothetical protein [Candidatus Pacearchaeota archaeon]
MEKGEVGRVLERGVDGEMMIGSKKIVVKPVWKWMVSIDFKSPLDHMQ